MQSKFRTFSNFSRIRPTPSHCFRPDGEPELSAIFSLPKPTKILARGNGLSYSDCCLNTNETIIDTSRLNHILSFDPATGIAVCQAAVTFADLFLLDPKFIPPVLPGTLHATLAGGIANDVHGKNNPHAGSFGHHIEWLELQIGSRSFCCSRTENSDLFQATIAGLGLTGIIKRMAIRLQKASHFVTKRTEKFTCLASLLQRMQNEGIRYDYQVAWLDLLYQPRALLSLATHTKIMEHPPLQLPQQKSHAVLPLPLRVINRYTMRQFNRAYYYLAKTEATVVSLQQFNNPLDTISHWNRLYGRKGLLQFQAVFNVKDAEETLMALLAIIRSYQATPTLAVLKYFTEKGRGFLSFCQPGFTVAIDFINNRQAHDAIKAMNQLITSQQGKVYLAKDLFLNHEQFTSMYPQHEPFQTILKKYKSPMHSDMNQRLGIR